MTDIQFICPKCGHNLAVDPAGAGMTVPCPECNEQITILGTPPLAPDKQAIPGLFRRIVAYLILPTLLLAPIGLVLIPFIYLMFDPMPNLGAEASLFYLPWFMAAGFAFLGAGVLYFFGQFLLLPYLLFINKSWSGKLFARGLCFQSALLIVCSAISISICRILFR